MTLTILQAIGLFVATNIDHLVVLSLFFNYGRGRPNTLMRIFVGQYLGFGAILVLTFAVALGSRYLLPEAALPWFGLIPLILGIKAGVDAWRESREEDSEDEYEETAERIQTKPLSILAVAGVTFANGGDEIGVYVPVFAVSSAVEIAVYVAVFLIGVAGVVFLARFIAHRPRVARFLSRYEDTIFPVVLIALGLIIIVGGLL